MELSTQELIIAALILSGIVGVLLAWVIRLEVKLRRLSAGKSGASLEDAIAQLSDRQKELAGFRKELEPYLQSAETRIRSGLQAVSVKRFDPFGGNSGNQSFAAAFLSENGDGIVISSIYTRERMSVFAKPIQAFASEYALSEEETAAIADARAKLAPHPDR